MAEELPAEIPEEPEAPELVVWSRWLRHHFKYEGRVIWRAPFTALILIAAGFGGATYLGHQREENAAATIENQKSQIGILQEETKGLSPQLAALQSQRDDTRKHLEEFYIQGGELFNRQVTNASQSSALQADEHAWVSTTTAWIENNMGKAASARLLDPGDGLSVAWNNSFDLYQQNIKGEVAMIRRNLSTLIETAAWDGNIHHEDSSK